MYGVIRFKRALYEFSNKFVSKWLVLGIDLLLVTLCYFLAYLLHHEFNIFAIPFNQYSFELPAILTVYFISFLSTKSFHGVIRHTSMSDAWKIMQSAFMASILLLGLDYILYPGAIKNLNLAYIPTRVIVIHSLLCMILLTLARLTFKVVYYKLVTGSKPNRNVMIYGAGNAGITTLNSLIASKTKNNFKVIGFFDENTSKIHKTINGYRVYDPNKELESTLEHYDVQEVIFSIQNIPKDRKRILVDRLLEKNIEVKMVPPIEQWIDGELDSQQIKKVRIEDLLGRDTIQLDFQNISEQVDGKVILVTGAAGSIGSEICRQLLKFTPAKLILLDQSETGVFEIENELREKHKNKTTELVAVIADVSCYDRLAHVFDCHKVGIVYHAAAYKHVPLMENNPCEAVLCNVQGTKNLADLSLKYGVRKFVMISTDKAVNPTNVMGSSKRIAEIYVQTLQKHLIEQGNDKVKFITTRFGNVLGSNGSVIPVFRRQIEAGGPVKVTHPDITRYFMTIPEACQLVLEAGAMGKGGEIFIFDMGESVKILDLAKKMIRLSGLVPGVDIKIAFTGLREGEKLYEELLNNKEKTIATHHEKIMIAKVRKDDYAIVKENVDTLILKAKNEDNMSIVRQMKIIVPEYISKNSIYEQLDLE